MASLNHSVKCLSLVRSGLNLTQRRTVVSGPPSYRLSFVEKCMHGVAFTIGMFAVPLWVLSNIRSYRGGRQ